MKNSFAFQPLFNTSYRNHRWLLVETNSALGSGKTLMPDRAAFPLNDPVHNLRLLLDLDLLLVKQVVTVTIHI